MISNILLKFWREILILILVLVCAFSFRQCSVKNDDNRLLLNSVDSAFSVAHYYKNKNGELVGQVKTQELTIGQYKKYAAQLGFDNKELKKQVGKESRLVAHWRGKAESEGTILIGLNDTTINTLDPTMDLSGESINIELPGLEAKTFQWGNKYLTLDGIISLDSNQMAIKYQYDTDFSITAYYKPQGLFKRSQLVTDIWFEDPNMKVQEFKGFVIKEPRKKFFQTGLFKVTVGIGIGYGLSKIF
jgi:hypothetical protein